MEHKRLSDVPRRCPPPVPPKPANKAYLLRLSLKRFDPCYLYHPVDTNSESNLKSSVSFSNDSLDDRDEVKNCLKKFPPAVLPKSNLVLSIINKYSSGLLSQSDVSDCSHLCIRNNLNNDGRSERRHGVLLLSEETTSTYFPFTGSAASIDAFTTEDKDLFSNTRSLSMETQIHSGQQFLPNDLNAESVSNISENIEKNSSETTGSIETLETIDCRSNINLTVNDEKQSEYIPSMTISEGNSKMRDEMGPQRAPEFNNRNINRHYSRNQMLKTRRTKLTSSVSFMSFDNIRNSSTKEISLKRQLIEQLIQKQAKLRQNSHESIPEVCLEEEGSFSDEEDNASSESNLAHLSLSSTEIFEENKAQQLEKSHRIALELMSTEICYVKRLELIDQVFHLEILLTNRELSMFPKEVLLQIFSNIKSIYQFHRDFLLQQLEKRMAEWEVKPRIGDIMKAFAPFLMLYTEYVQNFDNAINVVNFWLTKSSRFSDLMDKLQKRPECGHMSLQHHLLEPVQRVPRYLVLLREYIRYLPEDSDDGDDAQAALDLVERAVSRSNESLRTFDKFQKLLNINELLGNAINVVDPTRRFVKEGKLKRISPRDGSQTDRYIFLFNDLVLICQAFPLKLGSRQQYKLKIKMDTFDIELIEESHNLLTPDTFYLMCKEKCVELLASNQKFREEWIKALSTCINACSCRRSYIASQVTLEELGKRAPFWTKNHETSMCMVCTSAFKRFTKRRHCHACGIVACSKCSPNKMPLEFSANKRKRVCSICYANLQKHIYLSDLGLKKPSKNFQTNLKVKASDRHIICGYLKMCNDKKNWQSFYVTINENYVLYTFKAHKDVKAYSSLPLPGYCINSNPPEQKIFVISHRSQSNKIYFLVDDESLLQQWVGVLSFIVRAELPQDFTSCRSIVCPSQSSPT